MLGLIQVLSVLPNSRGFEPKKARLAARNCVAEAGRRYRQVSVANIQRNECKEKHLIRKNLKKNLDTDNQITFANPLLGGLAGTYRQASFTHNVVK